MKRFNELRKKYPELFEAIDDELEVRDLGTVLEYICHVFEDEVTEMHDDGCEDDAATLGEALDKIEAAVEILD